MIAILSHTYRPKKTLWITFKNIINSTLFLGVYVAVFRYMLCITKNTRGKVDRWNLIAACFVCSFGIMFEERGRLREIVMYMIPRALESLYNLAAQKGMVKHFAYAEVLVFAFAMAFIMYYYENDPEKIKPTYRNLLKKFFGTN